MYFNKIDSPPNFRFAAGPASRLAIGVEPFALTLHDHGSDVFRLSLASPRWPRGSDSQARLDPGEFSASPSEARLTVGDGAALSLSLDGVELLAAQPGRGFGVNGSKWLLCFEHRPADRFYGMGEKNNGFEKSGLRTLFWNTDVWADFDHGQVVGGTTDPMYANFPVLIIKSQGLWAAIVVDNPHAVFMNTGATEPIFQPGTGPFLPELFVGSRDGAPDLWFFAARDPVTLVRRLQGLQGRTPLPPLWALGHHQCRWGYRSAADLDRIAQGFVTHGIPNDGLWLDIDYMDGFRVFTVDSQAFANPAQQLKSLQDQGFRVVPILDPGFRRDPEYPVYAQARAAHLLCQTSEGQEFIGYVWPGYTVFPDFSLPEARDFWAEQVSRFSQLGFAGFWIDMNDPSTGSVPNQDMLFGHGSLPHSAWHNQYGLGMAMATRAGLQAARPRERPFLISRSAWLSASRHTAVWTGDNYSNPHHLKNGIEMSLNLSVSGLPFNGPDVPGFGGDSSNELLRLWYKAGFLFPFLRNHSLQGTADQEPWSRDRLTTRVAGEFIRLRYRLLPYLYNLFIDQEELGDPILRPLWYHDPSAECELIGDQFLVGPAIMQAPFLDPASRERRVQLPAHAHGQGWFDVQARRFRSAPTSLRLRHRTKTTPLFLAAPSIIPLQAGECRSQANDLGTIDFLVVMESQRQLEYRYRLDDGLSLDYLDGKRSNWHLAVDFSTKTPRIHINAFGLAAGGLRCRFLFLAEDSITECEVNGQLMACRAQKWRFAGQALDVDASPVFTSPAEAHGVHP